MHKLGPFFESFTDLYARIVTMRTLITIKLWKTYMCNVALWSIKRSKIYSNKNVRDFTKNFQNLICKQRVRRVNKSRVAFNPIIRCPRGVGFYTSLRYNAE